MLNLVKRKFDPFRSMQEQLNKERRAMEKHWKQHEKEIERVVKNTACRLARLFHELEDFICKAFKGEAIVNYCSPLITQQMTASALPVG
ncbi:MAG: hypothetical protein PVJ44_06765 [Desulfobacterales bacterium]|jgi:hypothetical protein